MTEDQRERRRKRDRERRSQVQSQREDYNQLLKHFQEQNKELQRYQLVCTQKEQEIKWFKEREQFLLLQLNQLKQRCSQLTQEIERQRQQVRVEGIVFQQLQSFLLSLPKNSPLRRLLIATLNDSLDEQNVLNLF